MQRPDGDDQEFENGQELEDGQEPEDGLELEEGSELEDNPELDDDPEFEDVQEFKGDQEFQNHCLFLQHTLNCLLLKYAIKHADLGLLRRAIDKACYLFSGSSHHKYAHEIMKCYISKSF